jgi:8-oxo-(d)GTP phosphatase
MAEDAGHRVILAAGGVVWRPGQAGPEIALVHRPRYDDWSHPKGKRQPGEHLLVTAIREIREETGLGVVLGGPLATSEYPVAAGTKRVSFWAARCSDPAGFVPNDEVDALAWLPPAVARERLSYQRDVVLAEEFASGPAQTVPLIVLRHAEAGSKPEPESDDAAVADLARPLDMGGVADARLLADLLACYGRCQVVSSAAERCLATVRPYAQTTGMQVQGEPAFTVLHGSMSPAELLAAAAGGEMAWARDWRPASGRPAAPSGIEQAGVLAAELARSGEPTLICAHRENLPAIIESAFTALGASPPPPDEPLAKSEFWVLHSAAGRLVAAERHGVAA